MRHGSQVFGELCRVPQGVLIVEIGDGLRGDQCAVQIKPLAAVGHLVTGHADHSLDVVDAGVFRVAKHHHVTAYWVIVGDDFLVDHRKANAVVKLIDQDQVAHEQGGDHRTRRDLERLKQERSQQEHRQDHGEEPGRPVEPPRLHQQALTRRAEIFIDAGDTLIGQLLPARERLRLERLNGRKSLGREVIPLKQPVHHGDQRQNQQQRREIAAPLAKKPSAQKNDQAGVEHTGQLAHQSSTWRMARKAS